MTLVYDAMYGFMIWRYAIMVPDSEEDFHESRKGRSVEIWRTVVVRRRVVRELSMRVGHMSYDVHHVCSARPFYEISRCLF